MVQRGICKAYGHSRHGGRSEPAVPLSAGGGEGGMAEPAARKGYGCVSLGGRRARGCECSLWTPCRRGRGVIEGEKMFGKGIELGVN